MTRRISRREHLLLLAALVIATATGVYVPRVRPARARAAALDEQRVRVEEQIREVRWPRMPDDPARLAARREALRAEVTAARETLRDAENRFVSRRDPALADDMRLEISALADRNGVRFRENLACPESAIRGFLGDPSRGGTVTDAARTVRFLALGEPYALRARQITLETDFRGLRGFLRDLDRLEHRVIILRFDISACEGGVPPLLATLVFVF